MNLLIVIIFLILFLLCLNIIILLLYHVTLISNLNFYILIFTTYIYTIKSNLLIRNIRISDMYYITTLI